MIQQPQKFDFATALKPLFTYFDENFAIMKQTLTDAAMIKVMTRLWKEVLVTIEGLLVPPLSDKPSQQKPLNQQEVDVVYKWLQVSLLLASTSPTRECATDSVALHSSCSTSSTQTATAFPSTS